MSKGLTLIELLVAITLLGLVMTAVVTIFTASVRGQTKILAIQELSNQTSHVIECVSRALRMAKKDNSSGSCTETAHLNYVKTESGKGIRFLDYQSKCHEFRLNTTTSQLQERKSTDHTRENFGSWTDITSDRVEALSFNIGPGDSWDQDDNEQPRVTIFFKIKAKLTAFKPGEIPVVEIQTTISQRNLDCYE